MSRIYEDCALPSRPVNSKRWMGRWDPQQWQGGCGMLLEGLLVDISRYTIADNDTKHRYSVLHIRPTQIHRRKYDANGHEIEPNFSETHKVATGYLGSSYKIMNKGQTDLLSSEELKEIIRKPELEKFTERQGMTDTLPFWIPESELENIELELGEKLRLKTKGNSPFLYSIVHLDADTTPKCNFAGADATGVSWTDKIMSNKGSKGANPQAHATVGDEVADDEWDD
uniref:arpin isoform X1 n=2 Tax=Myxine glutinosa TaxID=7769 RepID=UPI00358FD352